MVKPLESADTPLYTVKAGDTLFSIAKTNGIALRDLAAWNNIEDPTFHDDLYLLFSNTHSQVSI